uniref:Glucosylceramidase n=1 Tax=Timema poppense TaxID=170557 RepID=A0A7R9CV11_TIMPO|nr:unnamed protein product [Timema poppensis]
MEDSRPLAVTTPIYTPSAVSRHSVLGSRLMSPGVPSARVWTGESSVRVAQCRGSVYGTGVDQQVRRLCIAGHHRVSCGTQALDCAPRDYGDGIVCVCDAGYCDKLDDITEQDLSKGNYLLYTSSKAGDRLAKSVNVFESSATAPEEPVFFHLKSDVTYQEIMGFGGALTDSTGLNIMSLSDGAREKLLQTYFGEGGSQYLYLRVPIGASDFSLEYYTYDDVDGDVNWNNFALRDEDYKYKMPVIKRASDIRGQPIKLFGAAWSAPWWMKRNGTEFGFSYLLEKYYQTWADYYVKYFDAYKNENISFWGLSAQNEPTQAYNNPSWIFSMGWSAEQQRDWIAEHLGPTLQRGGYGDLELMTLDDNRMWLPGWVETVLENETTNSYVSGIGLHWYTDESTDPIIIDQTHELFPDKFLFYTEACELVQVTRDTLGDWAVGEHYGNSMFQAFNHWVNAWADWNMAINEDGGPSTYGYNAAIIVNATGDEFYKQPPYYFQTHFSAFIPPGSKRIEMTVEDGESPFMNVAFLTPESTIVSVIMNP